MSDNSHDRGGARIEFHSKLVVHADWSKYAKKRWCAIAVLDSDGLYQVDATEPVRARMVKTVSMLLSACSVCSMSSWATARPESPRTTRRESRASVASRK